MTEQELRDQAAKLKAVYAQNMNTNRQNSKAEYEADKQSFTTDANNQLKEQEGVTQTTKTNADINAFNNAKKLRELASAGGFTNGGELFSGTIQNEQQKGNQIGNANNAFSRYKGQWDNKLNEYNTKWNNNLNKLNTETDNAISEYNTKLDMDYNSKIESLRAQMAQAASAARSSSSRSSGGSKSGSSGGGGLTKTELYDQALKTLNNFMDQSQGYSFLRSYKQDLVNDLGQTSYDKLMAYYDKKANAGDLNTKTVSGYLDKNTRMSNAPTAPAPYVADVKPKPTKTVDTKNSWFNKLNTFFVK